MELTTVSVGKFPQEYTEEQIMAIAKLVGPVSDVKLMFDDMTGRLKGFAHIRYNDVETARLAVRNLNYMPIANNRYLRCVFTTDTHTDAQLPQLPLGLQIAMNQQADRVVDDIVAQLDNLTSMAVIADLKKMCQDNPELACVLFERYPQLGMAAVDIAIKTGATNPDIVGLVRRHRSREIVELSPEQLHWLRQVAVVPASDFDDVGDAAATMRQLQEDVIAGRFGDISHAN